MRELQKSLNDLGDLDFDLVSSRSHGHVDLVYNYLPYIYDHDQREEFAKTAKNGNDLGDLDFDLEVMGAC